MAVVEARVIVRLKCQKTKAMSDVPKPVSDEEVLVLKVVVAQLDSSKCLLQIIDDVLDVLYTDGEADGGRCDVLLLKLFGR